MRKNPVNRQVGQMIKRMRKSVGLSQWGLAKRMGITKGELFGIECGNTDITIRTLADVGTLASFHITFR